MYDYDSVEEHNKPNQLYFNEHVGVPKVTAAEGMMKSFSPTGEFIIEARNEPVNVETELDSEIVVVAVDSKDARLQIWENIRKSETVRHLIDARMGGESLRVYNIDIGDEKSMARYDE